MQKETKLYGLRAIQEAIEAEKSVDKVFLQNISQYLKTTNFIIEKSHNQRLTHH